MGDGLDDLLILCSVWKGNAFAIRVSEFQIFISKFLENLFHFFNNLVFGLVSTSCILKSIGKHNNC